MKARRYFVQCILFILVIFAMISLWGCAGKNEFTNTYIVPNYFGSEDGLNEFVKTLKKEKTFSDVKVTGDHQFTAEATNKQATNFVEWNKNDFDKHVQNFKDITGDNVEYADDYSYLIAYMETSDGLDAYFSELSLAIFDVEMIQVFSGVSDWKIDLKIIRPSDNKVLLDVVYPNEKLEFGMELWNQ